MTMISKHKCYNMKNLVLNMIVY